MELKDRALADLRRTLGLPTEARAHFNPEEARYLDFKQRVGTLLLESLGREGLRQLLDRLFLELLPIVLRAAGEHEGLHRVECEEEKRLLQKLFSERRDHLSLAPMVYSVNRRVFQGVSPAQPALDLGIGNGENSRFSLGPRRVEVGADVMLSNLRAARRSQSHEHYLALDLAQLPLVDDSFQRVYALNCIYHVQAGRRRALEEMTRVLAPGGELAFTDVTPHLHARKPLGHLLDLLGFGHLKADFVRYFLSGYGADGTAGDITWYRETLAALGFQDFRACFICSPRLSSLTYLFYDLQALFNFDAQMGLDLERYRRTYEPMLLNVVAPLVKLDEELCTAEGQGGYLFVTARKTGGPALSVPRPLRERLACPVCREALAPQDSALVCGRCGRRFPVVDGIPLLAEFYAGAIPGASSGA